MHRRSAFLFLMFFLISAHVQALTVVHTKRSETPGNVTAAPPTTPTPPQENPKSTKLKNAIASLVKKLDSDYDGKFTMNDIRAQWNQGVKKGWVPADWEKEEFNIFGMPAETSKDNWKHASEITSAAGAVTAMTGGAVVAARSAEATNSQDLTNTLTQKAEQIQNTDWTQVNTKAPELKDKEKMGPFKRFLADMKSKLSPALGGDACAPLKEVWRSCKGYPRLKCVFHKYTSSNEQGLCPTEVPFTDTKLPTPHQMISKRGLFSLDVLFSGALLVFSTVMIFNILYFIVAHPIIGTALLIAAVIFWLFWLARLISAIQVQQNKPPLITP